MKLLECFKVLVLLISLVLILCIMHFYCHKELPLQMLQSIMGDGEQKNEA
jgi:hypothetical protein